MAFGEGNFILTIFMPWQTLPKILKVFQSQWKPSLWNKKNISTCKGYESWISWRFSFPQNYKKAWNHSRPKVVTWFTRFLKMTLGTLEAIINYRTTYLGMVTIYLLYSSVIRHKKEQYQMKSAVNINYNPTILWVLNWFNYYVFNHTF